MTPYSVVRGIVLRETETKEADKILTLLTAEYGKISVIARGARRRNCRYAACAQPLAWSEWSLYHRGDWYYAREGTTLELFAGLRTDLAAMALGFYLAELTEAVTVEEQEAEPLLRHLLNGLYALSALHKPLPQVKAAFEWKLLSLAGYEPLAEACASCGKADPEEPFFFPEEGVLRCRGCGAGTPGRALPLCPASLAALRHIIYGDARRLYAFRLGPEPLARLGAASEAFTASQLERRFQTLDFYRSVAQPLDAAVHSDRKDPI